MHFLFVTYLSQVTTINGFLDITYLWFQGYVTELLLTLEAAVDSLESDFRPLDFMKEIFKSTPNLNNKEGSVAGVGPGGSPVAGKRSPGGGVGVPSMCPMGSHLNHARSTSYSVSYCMRKATGSPSNIDAKGRLSNTLKIG